MMELGRHGGYIIASYAATAVIIGGLIVMTVVAYRKAQARLTGSGDDAV